MIAKVVQCNVVFLLLKSDNLDSNGAWLLLVGEVGAQHDAVDDMICAPICQTVIVNGLMLECMQCEFSCNVCTGCTVHFMCTRKHTVQLQYNACNWIGINLCRCIFGSKVS